MKDKVAGVSCTCAEVFGATDSVAQAGYSFLEDNAVPGTSGLPSLHNLSRQGYTVVNY